MTCRGSLFGTDWDAFLGEEFMEHYWAELHDYVDDERSRLRVHPTSEEVFKALELTSCADTKVVILGQDPYHGRGLAHGLAFSVRSDVRVLPPTLKNIRRELLDDLDGDVSIPEHGSLASWARNGVLLLNTVLTVRQGEARSHRGRGWERLTDQVIKVVNMKPDCVVLSSGASTPSERRSSSIYRSTRSWSRHTPRPDLRTSLDPFHSLGASLLAGRTPRLLPPAGERLTGACQQRPVPPREASPPGAVNFGQ